MNKFESSILKIKLLGLLDKGTKEIERLEQEAWKKKVNFKPRSYKTISFTQGSHCARLIWLRYRTTVLDNLDEEPSPQLVRIFRRGRDIEDEIVLYYKAAGLKVTGTQEKFYDFNRVFRGKCDLILFDELVIEVKSMRNESYNNFLSQGIQKSHYHYYVQLQLYIHYLKMTRGAMVVENKNTSEYEAEIVPYDKTTVTFVRDKIQNVLNSDTIRDIDPKFVQFDQCTFCEAKDIICKRLK